MSDSNRRPVKSGSPGLRPLVPGHGCHVVENSHELPATSCRPLLGEYKGKRREEGIHCWKRMGFIVGEWVEDGGVWHDGLIRSRREAHGHVNKEKIHQQHGQSKYLMTPS